MLSKQQRQDIVVEGTELAKAALARPDQQIQLVAWLFAISEWLHDDHPGPGVRGLRPDTWERVLAQLTVLDADSHLPPILLGALLAFDVELRREPWRWADMPPSSQVQSKLPVGGRVRHRVKPVSSWRALQRARLEVMEGPLVYNPRPSAQLQGLAMEREGGRYSGIQRQKTTYGELSIGKRLDQGRLRVAFSPLRGASGPRFLGRTSGFVARMDHAPVTAAALEELIRHAADQEIALLLLPELHVRPREVEHLCAVLEELPEPMLVVAGSFHVEREGGMWNLAPLLCWPGEVLWEHRKGGFFRLTRAQLGQLPTGFVEPLPTDREAEEEIQLGRHLHYLDSPLGRIALLICADCLDGAAYEEAVRDLRPDLLLVVSLSAETRPFEEKAASWTHLGISTLWVNADFVHSELLAFATLALAAGPDHPAPRIRWRHVKKQDHLEVWHPKRAGAERWEAARSEDGVHLDPLLGMVLELGLQNLSPG